MTRGSCLCGAVAFEIEGRLTPIQLCHAARCRKATGGAFAPELLAPREGFRWIRGEDQVATFEAPVLEAPPAYRRAFCRTCGSPLPVAMPGGELIGLLAGVLDDDPGTQPFRHAFLRQQAAWYTIHDELPRFEWRPPQP